MLALGSVVVAPVRVVVVAVLVLVLALVLVVVLVRLVAALGFSASSNAGVLLKVAESSVGAGAASRVGGGAGTLWRERSRGFLVFAHRCNLPY